MSSFQNLFNIRQFLTLAAGIVFFVLPGCLSAPQVGMIHESPQGTISLKTFSDSSFLANHPKTLEPSLLGQILRGMYLEEKKESLASMLPGNTDSIPAFTEPEIQFLAPWLSSALAQANVREQVFFTLYHQTTEEKTQTDGSLYISDPVIYVTLDSYHFKQTRPSLPSNPSPSFRRPKSWRMLFVPEEVFINNSEDGTEYADGSGIGTLEIAYEQLNRLSSSPAGEDTAGVNDQEKKKEMQRLREEVQQLRKSLHEQDTKLKNLEESIKKP